MHDALISVALGALVPLAVACLLFLFDLGAPPVSVPLNCAPASACDPVAPRSAP